MERRGVGPEGSGLNWDVWDVWHKECLTVFDVLHDVACVMDV